MFNFEDIPRHIDHQNDMTLTSKIVFVALTTLVHHR